MLTMAFQFVGESYFHWSPVLAIGDGQLAGVLIGITFVFVLGVVDDVRELSAGVKFGGQILAAAFVVYMGVRIDFVGTPFGGGVIDIGWMSWPITMIWIVAFTNVINLIDGMDGLAAGVTAIAAISFLVLANLTNQLIAATMAAVLVGVCIGFLRYNFNPASIFMGDSGSMFLGFTLAAISCVGVLKSAVAITLVLPLLIIGVPVFDTGSAIIRRWRHQKPIHVADKGHIHHRLLSHGFSQRQTVLIIYAWSALLAVGAYAMRFVPSLVKWGVFVVMLALSALMAYWMGLFEPTPDELDEDARAAGAG
jgi:UDP-GlcNAc:undecaprenyl-phosphate GlcNAc-1-phosphate transferase